MSKLSMNLGLPAVPLSQNSELGGELLRVYNAIKNVARAHDVVTGALQPDEATWGQLGVSRVTVGGMAKVYPIAYENLLYGQLVGIYNDAGIGKAALAAEGTLKARGYCSAVSGTLAGLNTEITLFGRFPSFPAATLTPGANYFLSATPGSIAASGTQVVGFAFSDTELVFNPQY